MPKIRASRELFDSWKELSENVDRLKAIVQNDMGVTSAELDGWLDLETHKHAWGRK